jgi:peroxiredoxin (alkyl hydroperoxide reductase subunit C)
MKEASDVEENNVRRMPLIGDKAPEFEATTTQGSIKFPDDYKGKWVILFSHPADFTPYAYGIYDLCLYGG